MKEAIEVIRFYWWAKEYGNVWKYLEFRFPGSRVLGRGLQWREKG